MPRLAYRLASVLCVTLGACAPSQPEAPAPTGGGAPRPRAVFIIIDTSGNRIGQITGSEAGGSAVLEILVKGLTPGRHGLHLHATPACDAPGFTTAGAHLNPDAKLHGSQNPAGPHAGDLPNLTVTPDGVGRGQVMLMGWTLAPGPKSISSPGTALVVHADPDDERTDPTGNSGARVACGVITLP
jgi:Cu-Zn family superoxide dismutase